MVTHFWPKLLKFPNIRTKPPVFASVIARMTIFPNLKHNDCKRNPKKWGHSVHWNCTKLPLNIKNVNFYNVLIFINRITKCEA